MQKSWEVWQIADRMEATLFLEIANNNDEDYDDRFTTPDGSHMRSAENELKDFLYLLRKPADQTPRRFLEEGLLCVPNNWAILF